MCIFDADRGESSNFSGGALCFQLIHQEVLIVKIDLRAQHFLGLVLKEFCRDLFFGTHLGCDILKELNWERNRFGILFMQQGLYKGLNFGPPIPFITSSLDCTHKQSRKERTVHINKLQIGSRK